MTEKKSYSMSDLVAQCDPNAPIPDALREWDQSAPVGLEKVVMGDPFPTKNERLKMKKNRGGNDGNHAG